MLRMTVMVSELNESYTRYSNSATVQFNRMLKIMLLRGRIFRPQRSSTYVDAAYCYRPSSVVCLSVCHSSQPCKNG